MTYDAKIAVSRRNDQRRDGPQSISVQARMRAALARAKSDCERRKSDREPLQTPQLSADFQKYQ